MLPICWLTRLLLCSRCSWAAMPALSLPAGAAEAADMSEQRRLTSVEIGSYRLPGPPAADIWDIWDSRRLGCWLLQLP